MIKRALASIGIATVASTFACATPEPLDRSSLLVEKEYVDAAPSTEVYATDRVIIRAAANRAGVSTQDHGQQPNYHGQTLTHVRRLSNINADVYRVPEGVDAAVVAEDLRTRGEYESVDLDYRRRVMAVNDPYRSYQWHFDTIHAEDAWLYSTGENVVIAVIDTGLETGGNDGINATVPGWGTSYGTTVDGEGHGTHVAGTLAQATNNGIGVAGLAHGSSIMSIKALDDNGNGWDTDIIDGIDFAVVNGAQVINMSLGGGGYSVAFETAVQDAWNNGVFLACAAGNYNTQPATYPARFNGCVGVSATDFNNALAYYSNYGAGVDIAAPGGDLTADVNGDTYGDGVLQESHDGAGGFSYYFYQGTSTATPQVAGAAALLMANGASNQQALDCLQNNAQNIGSASSFGSGLVRPDQALADWADDGTCDVTCPATETVCDDGVDNDCDGAIDSDDSDCAPVCLPKDAMCTTNSECCSGVCQSKRKLCR